MTRKLGAVTRFVLWLALTACTSGNQNFDNGEDGVGNNRPRSTAADGAVFDVSPSTQTLPVSPTDTDASTAPDEVTSSPSARNDGGVETPSKTTSNMPSDAAIDVTPATPGDSAEDASSADESAAPAEPICGDGVVNEDREECDDGNPIDDDDCSNVCMRGYCGDGIVQGFEACDDGNGPDSLCPDCAFDAGWMDGVVDVWEECDDGASEDTDSCIANQGLWARCGDGYVYTTNTDPLNPNPLEECDDGNANGGGHCSVECKLVHPMHDAGVDAGLDAALDAMVPSAN